LHQVCDLFELNVKLRCQKVKQWATEIPNSEWYLTERGAPWCGQNQIELFSEGHSLL
jgi:hypothetical protein